MLKLVTHAQLYLVCVLAYIIYMQYTCIFHIRMELKMAISSSIFIICGTSSNKKIPDKAIKVRYNNKNLMLCRHQLLYLLRVVVSLCCIILDKKAIFLEKDQYLIILYLML